MSTPRPWRLYLDAPGTPAYNMAKDEYCLERAAQLGEPSLRLYGWEGFALSLGRAQQASREIDPAACAAEGVPLVRRITGGRAVLHGSDLTYAVCAPTTRPPFQGGVLPIYREISRALVLWLTRLGRAPQVKAYTGRERAAMASPICFSTPSAFEILLDGKKLVGSAQRLLPAAFLQHGSIPLAPQHRLLARLFRGADAEAVRAQMTDLESLGILPACSLEEVRRSLVEAFAETLHADFQAAPWEDADEARVRALCSGYPDLNAATPPPGAGPAAAAGP